MVDLWLLAVLSFLGGILLFVGLLGHAILEWLQTGVWSPYTAFDAMTINPARGCRLLGVVCGSAVLAGTPFGSCRPVAVVSILDVPPCGIYPLFNLSIYRRFLGESGKARSGECRARSGQP